MPQAPGHPNTALIAVHGGEFGNQAEASLGQLLVDAFGDGVIEAIQEIATKKGEELAKEREKVEKAEKAAAEKLAKEEAAAKEKEAHKAAAHAPHAGHGR